MITKKADLDKIDKLILSILQEDCKITNVTLAGAINLSTPSTLERVRKLENNGFIKGYKARLNVSKLGFVINVLIRIKIKDTANNNLSKLIDYIKSLHDITDAYQTSGNADFIIKGAFNSIDSYKCFLINKIYCIDFIELVSTDIIIDNLLDRGIKIS